MSHIANKSQTNIIILKLILITKNSTIDTISKENFILIDFFLSFNRNGIDVFSFDLKKKKTKQNMISHRT